MITRLDMGGVLTADTDLTGWWVWVERDQDLLDGPGDMTAAVAAGYTAVDAADDAAVLVAVGPYPDESAAVLAMQDSLIVQALAEENCLDCWVDDTPPVKDATSPTGARTPPNPDALTGGPGLTVSVRLADLTDYDHTGQPSS